MYLTNQECASQAFFYILKVDHNDVIYNISEMYTASSVYY